MLKFKKMTTVAGYQTMACGVAFGAVTAQAADKIRCKVPVAFGTNLPALGDNILDVSGAIKQASGGVVQ